MAEFADNSIHPPTSEPQSKIRLVLCGVGRIGQIHLIDMLTMLDVEIVAIVDAVPGAAKKLADQIGTKSFASLQELFDDGSVTVDGVLICTPTHTHTELVKLCLSRGIPVFCEKPVAVTIEEVDECYALAREKGVPLLCGYQRRFDSSFVRLKNAIDAGQIGEIRIVKTTSRDHPLPSFAFLRTSGGIFHDCASHDIDVHRWLMGCEPVEVFATGHAFYKEIAEMNDYDSVVILLKWPNGAISTIDLCRNATYGYDQRIEVLGEKGMVQAENKPQTTVVISNEAGIHHDVISHSFADRYPDAYKSEIQHFIQLVRDRTNWEAKLRVKHADVRNTSIIASAAEESARTGKPVKLTF